ncbi:peptide ABC transporter substrate-binding protein [soil metagenome]
MKRLLFACLLMALAACSGQSGPIRAPCPAGQLCFETGNGPDPVSLDPNIASGGTWETRILTDLMIGLTTDDPNGDVMPGMATSWETSPDGLTWTFHLREAKWSDGAPVTADDFVYSMQRIMDPKTAAEYASILYFIKNAQAVNQGKMPPTAMGAKAVDAHTLVITLEHPAPYILEVAKHQTMAPIPKHAVLKWGDAWSKPEHYVSNGPYLLKSWRLGDRIHVERNPYFYDNSNVCLDQVDYFVVLDPASGERRTRTGELDNLTDGVVASNRIANMRRPGQIPDYVRVHTYLGSGYLAFNTTLPKFKDKRVRNALSMTIDRDFITKKLLRGGQLTAYTFVPPGVANYIQAPKPYWADWTFEQRKTEARKLLAAAGYGPKNPLKVEIKHRNSSDPTLFMPAVQADWKSIGVDVTLIAYEVQIAYQAYKNADFEIADAGWIGDYNDAMTFLYLMQSQTGANNYGQYKNPAYDALLLKADNEPDVAKRAEYLRQAEIMMQNDQPVATIWYSINKNLVNPRVTGWVDNINDHHPTRFLCYKGAQTPAQKAASKSK